VSIPQGTYGRNVDPPNEFSELPPDDRALLLMWIWRNLTPTKVKVCHSTSYGMKHDFENDTGLYVSNGMFKGAMLEAGYEPVDPKERNWQFRCTRAQATKRHGAA
jgi:hypothetical protein